MSLFFETDLLIFNWKRELLQILELPLTLQELPTPCLTMKLTWVLEMGGVAAWGNGDTLVS